MSTLTKRISKDLNEITVSFESRRIIVWNRKKVLDFKRQA